MYAYALRLTIQHSTNVKAAGLAVQSEKCIIRSGQTLFALDSLCISKSFSATRLLHLCSLSHTYDHLIHTIKMHFTQSLIAVTAAMLPMLNALPQLVHETRDFVSKGVFEHDGIAFELQTRNASASPAEAYQEFRDSAMKPPIGSPIIQRGYDPHHYPNYPWLNCTAEGTFVGGCNNNHKTAPKEFHRLNGHFATKQHLSEMMIEAFKDGRGWKTPRSICRTTSGANLCVSWDQVVKEDLRPDQRHNMVDFAMQCAGPQGMLSSQMRTGFQTNFTDPKTQPEWHIVCVSNRPKDCQRNEWFCSDLWNWPKHENRGKKFESNPSLWNPKGWKWPWAQGPCTENCDGV